MKKLLYLTNDIPEYRGSFLKGLSQFFDLKVCYYGKSEVYSEFYQIEKLDSFSFCGFVFFKKKIFDLCRGFDSVLVMGHSRIPQYTLLALRVNRSFSLTYWGLEVSSSYNKEYDKDRKWDFIRVFLMKKSESSLFYCEKPRVRYIDVYGLDANKIFIANNTVDISKSYTSSDFKKHFLFVGTLYKEKNFNLLLHSYEFAFKQNPYLPPLLIIGDGPERDNIETFLVRSGLNEKVKILGAIYDQLILDSFFSEAIATLSPGQAGLSVLASLGRGVPFVTCHNSITGGERFNVIDGYNGYLIKESIVELAMVLTKLSIDSELVKQLCLNSRQYYLNFATMKNMIDNAKLALDYAYNMKFLK